MDETQEELKPVTTVQLLDAAIWREIGSDEPNRQKLSSKLFPASWLVGCSPVPKLPRWKH